LAYRIDSIQKRLTPDFSSVSRRPNTTGAGYSAAPPYEAAVYELSRMETALAAAN